MADDLVLRVAARFSTLTLPSRVAARYAKKKQSEAPPKELVKAVDAAMGKMEGALKAKTGLKWESLGGSEYEDDLLAVHFQGPTKKGTKSPYPMEVNGRFHLAFQVVRGGHSDDGTVDITASYMPWVKDRLEMSDSIEAQERGVTVDKADEVAVKLLGELAGKAKALMKKK